MGALKQRLGDIPRQALFDMEPQVHDMHWSAKALIHVLSAKLGGAKPVTLYEDDAELLLFLAYELEDRVEKHRDAFVGLLSDEALQ